jgi:DNA repair exonuclease SbcCD ATPase subunit
MNQKAAEVRMIYNQRDERVVAIADLECTVQNLEDDQKDVGLSKDQLAADLAAVEQAIKSKESQLQKLLPNLTATRDKEAKAKQRYFSYLQWR